MFEIPGLNISCLWHGLGFQDTTVKPVIVAANKFGV